VRDAAKSKNDTLSSAEIRAAMAKKAEEFKQSGGEIYLHSEPRPAEGRANRSSGSI